ncbi:very short patch repair endonuclease [Agromyces sp. NPDC058064]|uniref:very short patch repair endonuclease n=1 Tax=Agromyces sp. NPDC058064 TaxID=3346322 RepID=UPI0036D9CF2F
MIQTSWASSDGSRNTMRANRSRDTGPELAIRRLLHSRGRRYRVNFKPIQGLRRSADVVFTKQRVVVFIDGCFWHGCPVHYVAPKVNAAFWSAKIDANRARDADTTDRFLAEGWCVVRIWEHEAPDIAVALIECALSGGRATPSPVLVQEASSPPRLGRQPPP